MKFYTLFSLAGTIFQLSKCIKIKPELQKNILNFGYGINYKYERIWQILCSYKIYVTYDRRYKIF